MASGSINARFSISEVLSTLRAIKAECIKTNSDEPVREYFTALQQKVRELRSEEMDSTHRRIQDIWTAQFDKWYVDFQAKLPQKSEVDW